MSSNPSLSWQKIQDVAYSLQPCYETLNWSIGNLYADYKVRISTNSTVVALSSKYSPYPSVIDIYTVSGNKLWSIVYNSTPTQHILDFVFGNEDLYVILSNQKFRHYKDLKGNFDEYWFTSDLISLDNFGDSNVFSDYRRESSDDTSPRKHVITNLESNESEEVFHVLHSFVWGKYLFNRLTNRFIITDLDTMKNYEIPLSVNAGNKIRNLTLMKILEEGFIASICFDTTVLSLKVDLASSSYEVTDHALTDGPFTSVTVSPNGQFIALLNEESAIIYVINSTFSQILLEYDTSNDSSLPYQIEWCGNDAIVLSLRDEIKVVGPNQASISFFYDFIDDDDLDFDTVLKGTGTDELSFTIAHLKNEPDGLRILTTKRVEFLSRVPESTRNLYQIGSSHPSTILLDCIDKLAQQSSKADTNISFLKTEGLLLEAMDSCLDAALNEFNPYWQKKILLAVSFGKAYVDGYYDSVKYLKVVNTIKVLNQLKSADLSIFLTGIQVEKIGWDSVIDLLLNREQHLLALKIIALLELQDMRDKIYIHWCCYKIKKEIDLEDMDLYNIISKKLVSARDSSDDNTRKKNYLSIVEVSDIAYEEGRLDLCNYLINLEPTIIKRVEQYLKFDKLEIALVKAFESGEYDLAKLILLNLHDTLSVSQFFKILHQNESKTITEPENEFVEPPSSVLFVDGNLVESFWVESIGKHDALLLEKYHKQEDMRIELAIERLTSFIRKTKIESLQDQLTYYEDYKLKLLRLLGHGGDMGNNKYYQSELKVLELRKNLTETYQTDFFSKKTLTEILVQLIKMHQLKQGHKVVKEFKISVEKFWHLILETYCKAKEFDRLHQFILSSSSDKTNLKSPIGFQVIVDTCLAYNAPAHYITTYISNCSDMHYMDKIQLYITNNDLVSAAQEAYRYKDIDFLNSILERATKHANDSVTQTIKSLITKLGY